MIEAIGNICIMLFVIFSAVSLLHWKDDIDRRVKALEDKMKKLTTLTWTYDTTAKIDDTTTRRSLKERVYYG